MRKLVPLSLLVLAFAVNVRASDPVGVYALVDRVVLEPDTDNPASIQIWGVFALADGQRGSAYLPAARGYLYYTINSTNARATRAEWADLRAAAGSGQPIGFGSRYKPNGRLRRASEPPAQPDVYPLGFGLVKVLPQLLGPTVARELQHLPAPASPAHDARVEPGRVTLAARNVANPKVQYVFEIESTASDRETSPPIPAGRGETTWTPRLHVRRGENYTWRVWVTDGTWRGPAASATFRGAQ